MAQQTTAVKTPEAEVEEHGIAEDTAVESVAQCCHHWVIQPADGPISNGSCQVCGEIREFKNYVESATWGDSRTTGKSSTASATAESTSDDEDSQGPASSDNDEGPNDAEIGSENED